MIKFINRRRFQGYKIIEHIQIENTEFAIGYCRIEVFPYATFFRRKGKEYINPISFLTREEAERNLIERINKEINFYRPFKQLVANENTIGGK